MFKYFIYKFGQFCVTHLPLKVSYSLALFVSDLQYYFSPRDRKAVKNNLKVILGNRPDLTAMTKEVFRNFGRYLVEFFRMARKIDLVYIKEKIKFKNIEALKKALDKGKGAIIVTGHIGNWELGGIILSMVGYPVVAIALPHKERPVNDLFNRQRELKGMTIVPNNIAIRRCIEALKDNKIVAVVADRDFNLNGELMDFLGRKTLMPKGAAMFSLQTQAPIVPMFLVREKEDYFTLMVEEPIFPPPKQKDQASQNKVILNLVNQYKVILEEKIRQHPTQWLMFRPFWVK